MSDRRLLRFVAIDETIRQPAEALALAFADFLQAAPVQVEVCTAAALAAGGEDSAAVPVLTYTHTRDNAAARVERLMQVADKGCCVMLGVHLDFPFIPVLRRRAQAVLGEVEIIEMPARAPADAAALQRLAEHFALLPAAAARRQVAAALAKQAEAPLADAAGNSATPEDSASARAQVDLAILAEMIDFPLLDIYNKLLPYLPAETPLPLPLPKDTETTYKKIKAMLAQADSSAHHNGIMINRCIAVCLLLLSDSSRKRGVKNVAYPLAAHRALAENDGEFLPLKELSAILAAEMLLADEPQRAYNLLAGILDDFQDADYRQRHYLLTSFFLRVLMEVFEALDNQTAMRECMEKYKSFLQQLNDDEKMAIGAQSSSKIRALRQKIGDVL